MIPDSFKQDLLNRVDIVELIQRYVPLKKSGANYAACCPFHSEKTPSFTVSAQKQFYHCFGCGAHGNAISFLMEYQGLGYVDAVRDLADSAGLKVPEVERGSSVKSAGPDLQEIMQRASRYYREQLKASPQAIDYLKSRGLTGVIAARFGIGYAPQGWQSLRSVYTDYEGEALKQAGLVIDAEGGRRYDRFRDRIMFPILGQRGSVIAFGGRVLGQGEPKYLNSPETPLFEKGRELYGLPQARDAIRSQCCAVVVEGYMDVVALAQHGIGNAVATLGTATSLTHVQKLLRMTDEVVFCFDGDSAGRRAAWHALEVSLPALADSKTVRFLFLPVEDDPDSFVRSRGAEAFQELVANARPLSEFLLRELKERCDMSSAEGRARFLAQSEPLFKRIAAPVLKLQLRKQLLDAADLTPEDVEKLTGAVPSAPARMRAQAPARIERTPGRSAEHWVLKCVMANPALAEIVPMEYLNLDAREGKALQFVVDLIRSRSNGRGISQPVLIEWMKGSDYEGLLQQLHGDELDVQPDEAEEALREGLPRIEQEAVRRRINVLVHGEIDDSGKEELRALNKRLTELNLQEKVVNKVI